jgi:hypothetical protein
MSSTSNEYKADFTLPDSLHGYFMKDMDFFKSVAIKLACEVSNTDESNLKSIFGRWLPSFIPGRKKKILPRLENWRYVRRRLFNLVHRECLYSEQIKKEIGGKTNNFYAGEKTLALRKKSLAESMAFLNRTKVQTSTGVRNLSELTMDSIKRFNELYVMSLGMQELAADLKYKALFLTITAPAEYHSNPTVGHNSWNKKHAHEAHDFIKNKWEAFGKELANKTHQIYFSKGDVFGFRVVEPHLDGTPHWHILLYLSSDNIEVLKRLANKHFAHSSSALKIEEIRSQDEDINAAAPTSYMSKYLIKYVGAKQYIGEVKSNGESAKKDIHAFDKIDAWRSATRIRGFQKIGILSGTTKWRLLRKLYTQFYNGSLIREPVTDKEVIKASIENRVGSKVLSSMYKAQTAIIGKTDDSRAFTDFLIAIRKVQNTGHDLYIREKYKNKYDEIATRIVGITIGVINFFFYKSNVLNKKKSKTIPENVLNNSCLSSTIISGMRDLNTIIQETAYQFIQGLKTKSTVVKSECILL